MNPFIWAALIAALGSPASALSQDTKPDLTELSIEQLMRLKIDEVYTASRFVQKISQAPANVTIMTSEEMRRLGHRTVADALRSARGTYVTNDRNYSYLGVRGFGLPADYNNRVLFLVDGHRVNDNVYDAHYPGHEFVVDMNMIDRVEFVRGPASSLYGSNAFFGVVNVMTRKGRQVGGAEVSGAAGSLGSYEGHAAFGKRFEKGPEVVLSGAAFGSKGETLYYPEFDDPATGSGVTRNADGERSGKVFGELSWKGFSLQGAWSERAKEVPTAAFGTLFPSDETRTRDQFGYATLKYEHTFDEAFDVLARLSYNRYGYRGDYASDDGAGGVSINKDSALGYWWGAELLLTRRFMDDRFTVTAGTEIRENFRQDQDNYDDFATYVNSQEDSRIVAAYAQADALILDELRINAGLRWDHYSTFGGTVNPRAALIYVPVEGTTFKALYGRAFRAPSAYESDWGDGVFQKRNPDLEPETIDTYELSVEREVTNYLTLFAGAFYFDCQDLLNLEVDPADGVRVFRNINEVHTLGAELEARLALDGGLSATASYSYQEAKQVDPDHQLRNSPRHLAKLALTVPLMDSIYAGLETQYVGERRTLQGNKTDDYLVTNLTLTAANIARGLDLSVSIYNLFDQEYFDPGSSDHLQDEIEQEGLAFRVKLTWKF